jgi:hypothetical protein
MLLLAWSAAFAILAVAVIIIGLLGMRIAIAFCTTERTRWIWDAIFALIGLALLWLMF